jgi:hypothetical protein
MTGRIIEVNGKARLLGFLPVSVGLLSRRCITTICRAPDNDTRQGNA